MALVLLGVISAMGRNKAEEENRQSGRQGAEATQLESAPGEYLLSPGGDRMCKGPAVEREGGCGRVSQRGGGSQQLPCTVADLQVGRSQVGERPHIPENRSPFSGQGRSLGRGQEPPICPQSVTQTPS